MEAEILSVICEYLDRFSDSLHRNCVIRLNHVSLVAAILFHNHIERKRHVSVCKVLNASKVRFETNILFLKIARFQIWISVVSHERCAG